MEGAAAGMAAAGVRGFPAVLTSFVGRVGAVREVAGLLGEYRLVTVTGPGGVGKTRLAGEVARRVADRFADGVWLAEPAPVRDPVRVAPAVAVALEVREQPGMPAADALMRVLARRQLLVVLDNCEHVIEEAARLCAGLREAGRVLGPDRARAAEQRGAAMSLGTAAEYALMLTTPSPPPAQAGPGTAKLSTRERELVTLGDGGDPRTFEEDP